MKFKLLIFDLDNTLFDYDRAENHALGKTLSHFGMEASEELKQSYRVINERNWQKLERGEISSLELRSIRFEEFGREHGVSWDPAEVSGFYLARLGEGGFLIDGAAELVGELRAVYPLAAVTNGISDVQRSRLSHSPFSGLFEPLVISDEVGVAKPDPAIFEILLSRAGITDRTSVLMIGDSLSSDMRGAAAAGIPSCWYNPGGAAVEDGVNPEFTVKNLAEIRDIVL